MTKADNTRHPLNRRQLFTATTTALVAGACSASRSPFAQASPRADRPTGLMLAYLRGWSSALVLIDVSTGAELTRFEGLDASHAVVPVESLNRFVVHGKNRAGDGVAWVIDVDPRAGTWKEPVEVALGRGLALHWSVGPGSRTIAYGTVGDGKLHVLDTKTLEVSHHPGGGRHANMTFFAGQDWLLATDRISATTTLRVIDRKTNKVLSATEVGRSAHGLIASENKGLAYVWADDGLHVVNLSSSKLGKHEGVVAPLRRGQRSWFCWTPQGGRYSHDYSWNPGDTYSPWLTVIDMDRGKLERIATPGQQPGILQVSPDGDVGMSGSHTGNDLVVYDLANNTVRGTVAAGDAGGGFFDRDLAFSRDRKFGFATNPGEPSVSIVDLEGLAEVARIPFDARPSWMKVLT